MSNMIEIPKSKYEVRFRVMSGNKMLASFSIYGMAEDYIWKMNELFPELEIKKVWILAGTTAPIFYNHGETAIR